MDQAVYSELNKRRAALSAELKGVKYAIAMMEEDEARKVLYSKGIVKKGTLITLCVLGRPQEDAFFEELYAHENVCRVWLKYTNKTAKGKPGKSVRVVPWDEIDFIDKAKTN